MSAIWIDSKQPSFLGIAPSFAFHELAEIHAFAPATYEVSRMELQWVDEKRGPQWNIYNAEVAHGFYIRKRPWWVTVV